MVNQVITIITVNTGSTTAIDHMIVIPDKSVVIKKAFVVLVLLTSVALFFLALPRVRAAFNYIPVDVAIEKINNKENLDDDKFAELIEIAQTSISLDDNPHYWQGLSRLFQYQGQKNQPLQEISTDWLKQEQYAIEQSLVRSPANSDLWYRLSVIHFLLHLPPEQIVKMLIMSITTDPNNTGILMQRLSLCLTLSQMFEDGDVDLLRSQILTAWSVSPVDFLSTVANVEDNISIIWQLLADKDSSILKEMVEALEKNN